MLLPLSHKHTHTQGLGRPIRSAHVPHSFSAVLLPLSHKHTHTHKHTGDPLNLRIPIHLHKRPIRSAPVSLIRSPHVPHSFSAVLHPLSHTHTQGLGRPIRSAPVPHSFIAALLPLSHKHTHTQAHAHDTDLKLVGGRRG